MRRIESSFTLRAPGPTDFTLLALPANGYGSLDRLSLTFDGQPVEHDIVDGRHGQREIRCSVPAGELTFELATEIEGHAPASEAGDTARYLESSRYIDVDSVRAFASERFGAVGRDGMTAERLAVEAIVRWIGRSFQYRPELSAIDDTSTDTMRKSGGMCRDYAHVTIALCRALGIPARYVSVYAPHLQPQDFHAVAEVFVDDAWWVVDATFLAPRSQLVRISTGLDASETAWATNSGVGVQLTQMGVWAASAEATEVEPSDAWMPLT